MDLQELDQIVRRSLVSAFRLETLPQYLTLTEQEAAEYREWQAGRPLPLPTPETSSWLARLQRTVADGYRWYRVHIMDHPLSDYSEFELYGYQANARAGEDIYIADRHAHRDLDGLRQDFWLIDDEIAVVMHYDGDGLFLRPERAADAAPYRRMRDTALRHAVPLADYLERAGLRPPA
ncbi:DUF6879 family protein [Frankia sp. Cr1]|uniref:DUF6879 family protein n=1 Tax=Frankia sp. Cr1 TaxID=3073931 RepID=UPI002AD52119|nr:DUF6879 family protein [Frankia sp. Cr1]